MIEGCCGFVLYHQDYPYHTPIENDHRNIYGGVNWDKTTLTPFRFVLLGNIIRSFSILKVQLFKINISLYY
jgi:hypothetical protein